jgi:spermidine synthase
MTPWEIIDHERVPNDVGTIYLVNADDDWSIQLDGRELMGGGLHGSEDALAVKACARLADSENARVLVGGLGMGFTFSAALRSVGAKGRVTVAELLPAVVRWNKQHVGMLASHPLDDPRGTVHQGDVRELVKPMDPPWSAILLDVDQGPGAHTRGTNDWLYTPEGLQAAWDALIPGGVLGIWSWCNDAELTACLLEQGFEVDVVHYHEKGRIVANDAGTHILWMAQRPSK